MPSTTTTSSEMIPFDGKAAETGLALLAMVRFARDLHAAPVPERMQPIPPMNKRGGRTLPPRGWQSEWSVVITEDMCNPLNQLHGGAAATLIDTTNSASLAVLATDSFWGLPMLTGVTLTLDLAYYNACAAGTKCRLTVTVEHLSKSLCNLRGELSDWETGVRFVSGTHVKTWRDLRPKAKM